MNGRYIALNLRVDEFIDGTDETVLGWSAGSGMTMEIWSHPCKIAFRQYQLPINLQC
jgi:environmental stress-induced protein Ves